MGISVAAAILSATEAPFRTTIVSKSPRRPYCMMGVCFDCLVTINGEANRQACLVTVQENMRVLSQHGACEITPSQQSS